MATGIVSTALAEHGARTASGVLLLVGLVGYAGLWVAYGWRLLRHRPRFIADLVTGPRGFAFLTVVAASDVLATRLLADGRKGAAEALLTVGVAGWLVLGYGVPLGMVAATRRRPALDQVNGTWFIWVVATESVAVASAQLARSTSGEALVVGASVCWAIGLVQYLLIAALGLARLLLRPVAPTDLVPAYWVFMGSAAISVLAGAKLIAVLPSDGLLPRQATAGLSWVLWSFCTWLIPLLLALGVWRHLMRRVPLRYEAALWSMVFPLGMYGVATTELGRATATGWLATLGNGETWLACAVWALVFLAMVAAAAGRLRAARRGGLAR